MQEEPNREEGSRLRRIPMRGSGDSPAEEPTVENPKAADPADGDRVAENPATESWETGTIGHEAGRTEDRPVGGWETHDPRGYPEEQSYREDRMHDVPQGTRMAPMGAQDEQTWSVLAHLSVLAGLVGLMPFGALIIWLVYKDRSPRVGFHALQSLWYQIAWIVILVVGWFITFILTFVLIGLLLIPVMAIASVVPFVHGCYAAYKVSQGVDYRYPYIADRIGGPRRTV